MFKKKITLKILLLLIFSDILETLLNLFFKKSALLDNGFVVNKFSDVFIFLKDMAFCPYLWLGICIAFLTFVIWSTILSRIDLSVAVPIASFSYIFIPISSIIFLHEKVTLLRWTGIFFILAGVIFVSLSSKEKEAL